MAPAVYLNVAVNGFCNLPTSGVPVIKGNLIVKGGAVFNGGACAELSIAGGVQVSPSAVFLIDGGCGVKTVFHGIAVDRANSVGVFESTVVGGIIGNGGGGGPGGASERNDVPLSGDTEFDIVDNLIGNVTINGYHGCVAVVGGNEIEGNVSVTNNNVEGANIIGGNLITGNLFCKMNSPFPILDSFGFNAVGGSVNRGACLALVP